MQNQKAARPTLAGQQVKQRKRILHAVNNSPEQFTEVILQAFEEDLSAEISLQDRLTNTGKVLEQSDLDFSKHGEIFFQLLFTGSRLAQGKVQQDQKKLKFNIMDTKADYQQIQPYVTLFQQLMRRRPYLVSRLESVVITLVKTLEFYDEDGRRKLAIALTAIFVKKLGILPDKVFQSMLIDRLILRGTVLDFLTDFFQEYQKQSSFRDLMFLLSNARMESKLEECFPPSQRDKQTFIKHFQENKLPELVEWYVKRSQDNATQRLQEQLIEQTAASPPAGAGEIQEVIQQEVQAHNLSNNEVVKMLWSVIIQSLNLQGKSHQQISGSLMRYVQQYQVVFKKYCNSAQLELELMSFIQVTCYEDSVLLKCFSDFVKIMYNEDIIGEDTVKHWYKKGTNPKGRNVFIQDIQPFIAWLDSAEEEDDE